MTTWRQALHPRIDIVKLSYTSRYNYTKSGGSRAIGENGNGRRDIEGELGVLSVSVPGRDWGWGWAVCGYGQVCPSAAAQIHPLQRSWLSGDLKPRCWCSHWCIDVQSMPRFQGTKAVYFNLDFNFECQVFIKSLSYSSSQTRISPHTFFAISPSSPRYRTQRQRELWLWSNQEGACV